MRKKSYSGRLYSNTPIREADELPGAVLHAPFISPEEKRSCAVECRFIEHVVYV